MITTLIKPARLTLGKNLKSHPVSFFAARITIVLASLCLGNSLLAATSTWNGGSSTDGNWSDSANWGGTALASGNAVTFSGTARQINTNDLSGYNLGNVIFSTANWNISGNPVDFPSAVIITDSVAGTCTWGLATTNTTKITVTQSATGDILNFTGAISGAGGFSKTAGANGQGMVYLSNTNNSFAGTVTIYSGSLIYYSLAPGGQNSSLGAGTGVIQLGQAGANFPPTFTFAGTNNGATDRTLEFGNFTTGTISVNNNSPNNSSLTFNGPVTSAGDSTAGDVYTISLGGTSIATNTFTGQIMGSTPTNINMQITGPGTWAFTNLIYMTGNLTIATNSHVVLDYDTDGGGYASTILFPTITMNSGATLDVSSYDMNNVAFVLGAYSIQTMIAGRTNGQAADINGSLSLAGADAATLNIAGQGIPGTLTISSNFIPAAGTILLDLNTNITAGGGTNDLIQVGGNLDLSQGVANVNVFPLHGTVQTNVPYTLITYTGSLIGNASGLNVLSPSRAYTTTVSTATPHIVTVTFNASGMAANLFWKGNVSQNWDVDTTANWLNGGSADYFYNGDNVTFNDSASQFTVNLVGSLVPNTITVSNNANNYVLSTSSGGTISAGSLTKQGTGVLGITTANTYSGGTVISAGTVTAGNNTALGSGSVVLGDANSGANPASLLLNSGTTLANAITVSSSGTGKATIGFADVTGTATLNGGITLQRAATFYGAYLNTNTPINVLGGITGTGDVTVSGGAFKWQATAGSVFTFTGNIYITNSAYLGLNGTISTNDNIDVASGAVLGEISYPPFNALNGSGSVQPGVGALSSGTMNIGMANGSGVFSGRFTFNDKGQFTSLNKNGTGTEKLTGDNSGSPGVTIVTAGTLAVNNTTGSGLGYGVVTVNTNGTLAGSGSIYSSNNTVTINNGGVLSVGNAGDVSGAAFTLTNTGGLFITNGGALNVDLFSGAGAGNNTGNPAAADVLNAQCPVTLDVNSNSVLNVANPNGMSLWAIGDQWKIANWNSTPINTFGILNLPTLPGTMIWNVTNLYTSGVISIIAASAASPTNSASITGVTLSGGNLIITGTNLNGGQSFHYEVLSATNLTVPLTNWTVLSTNAFNANGSFSYTNTISLTNPAVFFDTKAVQ